MTPTVTQLIDLLNKPALLKWANKIGLEGVRLDDYRAKSKGDGTDKHKLIENDLLHGIEYDNEQFKKFKSRYEILKVEPVIECEWYHGRADVLLQRAGVTFLYDFKNSERIYFEQVLQLVAYKRVLKCDKVGIVNTTSFIENIVPLTETSERHHVKILSALVQIWNCKKELCV